MSDDDLDGCLSDDPVTDDEQDPDLHDRYGFEHVGPGAIPVLPE